MPIHWELGSTTLFLHHDSKDFTVLAGWAGFKLQTQRGKAPGLYRCREKPRSDSLASTLRQQEKPGRTRAQQTKEFYPEGIYLYLYQGVPHGERSRTLLSQRFKCTSCVSYVSRGETSKPSTRDSLGTTTLSVRADASGVDDFSGYTGDLKRQHLVITTWGTEQLNRLNETVIIAVFHHHSKTQHNMPVR